MAKMMATLRGDETPGERKMYKLFQNNLADVYRVWHNRRLHPCKEVDFIVFEPTIGVWLIEVKDWSIDYIVSASPEVIKLSDDKLPDNPHIQIEQCWKEHKRELEKRSQLIDERRNKLKFPICKFVIYTNMYSSDIEKKGFDSALVLNNSWTRDLIDDDYRDQEAIENALRDRMKEGPAYFSPNLNDKDVDTVEKHFGKTVVADVGTKQEVGELDNYQSGLVDLPFNKQYVIEGPAGSGKSLVLVGRTIRIARENPSWHVGVFCFNALMSNYLREIFSLDSSFTEIKDRVHVHDITEAKNYNIKYDAILVDEGQDADDDQMRFYLESLKTIGSSFTIFYDKRQSIYTNDAGSIADRLNGIGFNIEGEKRLVKQQRSPLVIMAIAIYEKLNASEKSEEQIMDWVINEIAPKIFDSSFINRVSKAITGFIKKLIGGDQEKAHASLPLNELLNKSLSILKSQNMYVDSANEISSAVSGSSDVNFRDFVILIPYIKMAKYVSSALKEKGIPHDFINLNGFAYKDNTFLDGLDNRRTVDLAANTVKILTIHQSKGFDCKRLYILELDYLDSPHASQTDLGKKKSELVYIAMTRAKEHCKILYKNETEIIKTLNKFKQLMPSEAPQQ